MSQYTLLLALTLLLVSSDQDGEEIHFSTGSEARCNLIVDAGMKTWFEPNKLLAMMREIIHIVGQSTLVNSNFGKQ